MRVLLTRNTTIREPGSFSIVHQDFKGQGSGLNGVMGVEKR